MKANALMMTAVIGLSALFIYGAWAFVLVVIILGASFGAVIPMK